MLVTQNVSAVDIAKNIVYDSVSKFTYMSHHLPANRSPFILQLFLYVVVFPLSTVVTQEILCTSLVFPPWIHCLGWCALVCSFISPSWDDKLPVEQTLAKRVVSGSMFAPKPVGCWCKSVLSIYHLEIKPQSMENPLAVDDFPINTSIHRGFVHCHVWLPTGVPALLRSPIWLLKLCSQASILKLYFMFLLMLPSYGPNYVPMECGNSLQQTMASQLGWWHSQYMGK